MNIKSALPTKRRLTFSLLIVLLIAIFFIGYYFYYIPTNKNIQHNNGFLILNNIEQNIIERNEYLQTAFINILRKPKPGDSAKTVGQLQAQLDKYKIGAKLFYKKAIEINYNNEVSKSKVVAANSELTDSSVYLSGIYGDSLFYKAADNNNQQYTIYVPAKDFMQSLLTYQRDELYDNYLLIGATEGVIYTDAGLAINNSITVDSLIAKNSKALFAGIRDINISGTDLKMFYYPFKLGTSQLQLCGFVKASKYYDKLQQVPVTFIYTLVIALLLILMVLPLVKFYLMGKDEHVSYPDFILGMASFFVGTAMLTLIIIQVLLLFGSDLRASDNLRKLSTQIDNSFEQELTKACLQLDQFDSLVATQKDSVPFQNMKSHQNYNVSKLIFSYFKHIDVDSTLYYNFNRVAWVDGDGDQHLKAQLDTAKPIFANVASRNYFQVLKNSDGYILPGYPHIRFSLEAVNSWTNGGFNIIIALKSRLGDGSIVSLSAPMPSVLQTILPPGFGYCIIDNDGKVILHNDIYRNLQENLFEKTASSRQIMEAVKSRQETYFNDIVLYGKTNALYIKPVAAIPFHLVTFYDKGYILPINMRIFTFSLMFCIISFASCLLIWLGVFRKRYARNTFLYDPLFYLNWVVPKEKSIHFYKLCSVFLVVYLVIQAIMISVFELFDIYNYAILLLVLLLPVNIFSGLFVINYRVKKEYDEAQLIVKKAKPVKAISALIFQPVAVMFAYWYSYLAGYPLQDAFLYFELCFFVFLCFLFLLPMKVFHGLYKLPGSYIDQYCAFATLLIICLSAFPAGIFSWYAHNQEITQSVKKEQLYLANSLQNRAGYYKLFSKERDSLNMPKKYFDQWQHHAGIYSIYEDVIMPDAAPDKGINSTNRYENFYFSVANNIGNSYYDPMLIPALRDTATGNAWHWLPQKNTLSFWYGLYTGSNTQKSTKGLTDKALKITSVLPDTNFFVKINIRGILLLLLTVAFIIGLYRLLRFICGHLFLRKFVDYWRQANDVSANGLQTLFQQYKADKLARGTATQLLQTTVLNLYQEEYPLFKPAKDIDTIYLQEKNMIDALNKYWNFYYYIWENCPPKEKYLLLDFAKNGFVNFKNTEVIHSLFKKGILTVREDETKLFSASFRSYILTQEHSKEMISLQQTFKQEAIWQSLRIPILIVLLGIAFFVFFTQEQAFQKIAALVAGISSVFSLLIKFFSDGSNLFASKK
jgi:hypothetical protein